MVIEDHIGTVHRRWWPGSSHVYLEAGELHVGDEIRIRGPRIDHYERIRALKAGHNPVTFAHQGQRVQVGHPLPEGARVFLVHGDPYHDTDGAVLARLFDG